MPLKLRVQPELDDRSLSDVHSQATSTFDSIAREVSQNFTSGLSAGLGSAGREIFSGIGSAASSMGLEVSAGAAAAAAGIGLIVIAAEKAGEAFYGVGARFDAIGDTISARTGAIGSDLDTLTNSVRNLGMITASSLEDLANISVSVQQAFDAPQQQLDSLTKQIADFDRMTGDTANVREFGMVIRAFGDDAPSAGVGFELLTDLARQTGIPINELINNMRSLAPATQQLGLDFNQTAGLIQSFNTAGLDAGSTTMALNRAAGVFAEHGINMQTGLRDTVIQMQEYIAAGKESEARMLAGDVFGERAAGRMVRAIRDGTISVDSLNDGYRATGTLIADLDKKTADWAENWTKIKNTASDLANTVGGPLYDAINRTLSLSLGFVTPAAANAEEARQRAENEARRRELTGGGAIGSSLWVPGGGFGTTPQDVAGALADKDKKSGGSNRPLVPYPPGYTGSPVEKAQHDVAQAQSDLAAAKVGGDVNAITSANNRLTDANNNLQKALQGEPASGGAVQVPAPPGLGAPPLPGQTPEEYSRQQSYLGAVHTRQTAEARLAAAQTSGETTPNELLKAENDLVKARGSEYEAMLRLNDAASKTSDMLGDIGVKLDQDFGISQGLPGIAENLVRFLGNLAFAPAMGAMRGAQAGLGYPGGEGSGSGLMGILGSAGAFGPQYTEAGGGGRFAKPSGGGGGGGAQFPFGGFPGGAFPGGYPTGPSGLPITYPGGSPYPASGQQSGGGLVGATLGTPASFAGGVPLIQRPDGTWTSPDPAWAHLIARESGGRNIIQSPSTIDVNTGGNEAFGIFQITPGTWAAHGGKGSVYQSTPQQQAQVAANILRSNPSGSDWGAGLPGRENSLLLRRALGFTVGGDVDTVPAMLEPGEHVLTTADVAAMGGQSGVYAFRSALHRQSGGDIQLPPGVPAIMAPNVAAGPGKPQPPIPSAGVPAPPPGVGAPHAPPGAGPTKIGGAEPFAGYGPGFQVTGSGLVGLAESIPATLANAAITAAAAAGHYGGAVGVQGFQGGGDVGGGASSSIVSAAINIGMQELNRAISFAGQAAGIGVSGLMETFLPAGASELAQNSWATRFLGGIVGARPALPNIAGAAAGASSRPSPEQLGPPPLRTEHFGTGAPPGPTNQTGVYIENYNVTQNEDRAGQDLARHQMDQWPVQSGAR